MVSGGGGDGGDDDGNFGAGKVAVMGKAERKREKTRLRERRRRSITSKILEGLRRHGGYSLPVRADINDVISALAQEAGWVVQPDGTTYRAAAAPLYGASRQKTYVPLAVPLTLPVQQRSFASGQAKAGMPLPASSLKRVGATAARSGGGGGGECSIFVNAGVRSTSNCMLSYVAKGGTTSAAVEPSDEAAAVEPSDEAISVQPLATRGPWSDWND